MLTVTPNAKERLQSTIPKEKGESKIGVRIILSRKDPEKFELIFDKEKQGDQVVESEEGSPLMFVGRKLASTLDGMVLDYKDSPSRTGFTISKLPPNE